MIALLFIATGIAISCVVQHKPDGVWRDSVNAARENKAARARQVEVQRIIDACRIKLALGGSTALTFAVFAAQLPIQEQEDLKSLVEGRPLADPERAELNLAAIKMLSKSKPKEGKK